ncbi:hypothetical protein NEIRO03_2055, partial [Nematocida sp. AWRm78]
VDLNVITQDELLEEKRANLPKEQTKMTEEKYREWKVKREQNKINMKKEEDKIKEGNLRLGKILPSGKDLFVYNPKIFVDDDEALDYDYNAREEKLESDEEEELAEKLTETLNITS